MGVRARSCFPSSWVRKWPRSAVPRDAIHRAACRWAALNNGGCLDFDSDAIRVPAVATAYKASVVHCCTAFLLSELTYRSLQHHHENNRGKEPTRINRPHQKAHHTPRENPPASSSITDDFFFPQQRYWRSVSIVTGRPWWVPRAFYFSFLTLSIVRKT